MSEYQSVLETMRHFVTYILILIYVYTYMYCDTKINNFINLPLCASLCFIFNRHSNGFFLSNLETNSRWLINNCKGRPATLFTSINRRATIITSDLLLSTALDRSPLDAQTGPVLTLTFLKS